MKTPTTSLLLLFVLFCSGIEARTRGASHQAPSIRERPARQAMESIELLAERRQCIPYSDLNNIVAESRNAILEETCEPEACSGATSCCRVLSNSLVCDTDNKYAFSACVCNDFTRTRTPTQAPTVTAPAPSPTPGATDGSTGGNNGSGTEGSTGTDGSTGSGNNGGAGGDGSTGSDNDGSTGSGNDGNTGNTANDGNQDIVVVGDDNADINQINQEIKATQEEDHWYHDPTIMGSIAAGVLVLCAGILVLTNRFKSDSRQSRPVKQLAWDADTGSDNMAVEQHVELESVQSDYQLNGLPLDEELSMADSSNQEKKCCQPTPCHDFSTWIDEACAPRRARSYDTRDTVEL